ncbi:MAG: acyltransferase family protein [Propioniciclava sp.]
MKYDSRGKVGKPVDIRGFGVSATGVRAASTRPLSAALDGPDNALNAIRLVLALLVIVGHTVLSAGAPWPRWIEVLGGWSVAGFFVISGYLIAGSRMRSSWWSYSIRRLARIYPGYWVQVLVVALLFAPLATLLGPSHGRGNPRSTML